MPTVDLHQHLWPPAFVRALRSRSTPPRLDGHLLELAGGDVFAIDLAAHDPGRRAAQGPDVICLAASAGLGLDAELAQVWNESALELGEPFRVWAAAEDPDCLGAALERGAIGLELGADRLAGPDAFDTLAPLLERLGNRPLLVHPGPVTSPGRPHWWAPVVPYVSQLHAAWWAWADGGRERFPDLPVCFAALAGLGPLHGERHRARGGDGGSGSVDPLTFVETSSYGTQAVDATIRALGIDVVCHGSDRPYAEPAVLALDAAALHAIGTVNPTRLLTHAQEEVPA